MLNNTVLLNLLFLFTISIPNKDKIPKNIFHIYNYPHITAISANAIINIIVVAVYIAALLGVAAGAIKIILFAIKKLLRKSPAEAPKDKFLLPVKRRSFTLGITLVFTYGTIAYAITKLINIHEKNQETLFVLILNMAFQIFIITTILAVFSPKTFNFSSDKKFFKKLFHYYALLSVFFAFSCTCS